MLFRRRRAFMTTEMLPQCVDYQQAIFETLRRIEQLLSKNEPPTRPSESRALAPSPRASPTARRCDADGSCRVNGIGHVGKVNPTFCRVESVLIAKQVRRVHLA